MNVRGLFLQSERIQSTRFLICAMSFAGEVSTILCSSSWPSGNLAFSPEVMCSIRRVSPLSLPLYFSATFFQAGPSLSFSIAWHLKQLFCRARALAASTSTAALAAREKVRPILRAANANLRWTEIGFICFFPVAGRGNLTGLAAQNARFAAGRYDPDQFRVTGTQSITAGRCDGRRDHRW